MQSIGAAMRWAMRTLDLLQAGYGARCVVLTVMVSLGGARMVCATEAVALAAPPSIVLFIADDLGWGDVGFHGGAARTPHLDRLAQQGVELARFYVHPVCSPTRAALLTGRSPLKTGVIQPVGGKQPGLPLDEHLMPESFGDAGYQTALVGKWHLGGGGDEGDDYLPQHRGFDHFYGHVGGGIDYDTHTPKHRDRPDWQRNGQTVEEPGYTTDLIADEAVRLIEQRDTSRPMLMVVSFNAVHLPLAAPQDLIAGYSHITDPEARIYYAMIESMDRGVGRVVDAIDAAGMTDQTLIIFISDNGPARSVAAASSGGLNGAKGSVLEGGVRVPAVMRWPGVLPAGEVRPQVLTVEDLFPTLAACTGVSPGNEAPFDGRDLWPTIRDGLVVSNRYHRVLSDRGASVSDGRWKLVTLKRRLRTRTALYDLEADPGETVDRSKDYPAVVSRLKKEMPALE